MTAQTETSLLTAVANEYQDGVSWEDLRWFCVGSPVRAIVIVTRGKQTKQVKTISQTNTPEAWISWQPVLAEWQNERKTKKRTNHEKFGKGQIK